MKLGHKNSTPVFLNHHSHLHCHTMRGILASLNPMPNLKLKLKLSFLLLVFLIVFSCIITFLDYSNSPPSSSSSSLWLSLSSSSSSCIDDPVIARVAGTVSKTKPESTNLTHVVFGIGAAAKHWDHRKNYIKFWWRPSVTRGYVYIDNWVDMSDHEKPEYPELKISTDTSRFNYTNRKGNGSGIRMTRIVSEMVRLNLPNVRWFVMGDDDSVFFPDNLIRVLRKYDHNQMYYIGSYSETHLQNILFSYGMAYGGGGFAISYKLAIEIEKMQDRCIQRHSGLYGSDDRIQACVAELGVPLTREPGFHQFDIYGNPFGLLAAHPVAPLVTLHHLDLVDPIFPYQTRIHALNRLRVPAKLDSASLLQQSICYDLLHNWTVSVSWGYAVQIIRGFVPAREIEQPARTFLNWYRKDDPVGFSFNTRPVAKDPCNKAHVYYLSNAVMSMRTNTSGSEYVLHRVRQNKCKWKMEDPNTIQRIEVYKKPNPQMWDKAPRRNCCRIMPATKNATVVINVGECTKGEVIEMTPT